MKVIRLIELQSCTCMHLFFFYYFCDKFFLKKTLPRFYKHRECKVKYIILLFGSVDIKLNRTILVFIINHKIIFLLSFT